MKDKIFTYLTLIFLVTSCSRNPVTEHGFLHSISVHVFEWVGVELFENDEQFSLKDIHLDGSALLNHDVLVGGKVEEVGAFGTYIVISDERVRMLIDLSRLGGVPSKVAKGDSMRIIGKVQSGEKGHFYLVANAVNRG